MKRILLGAALALCFAAPAFAGLELNQLPSKGSVPYLQLPDGTYKAQQGDANGNNGASWTPTGYIQLTVSTVAVGLTGLPAGSTWCLIKFETNAVRWRDDGTNPTSSVGMPWAPSDGSLPYSGTLSAIKFIRQSADSTLNAECFK